jgi:hypothetical protein
MDSRLAGGAEEMVGWMPSMDSRAARSQSTRAAVKLSGEFGWCKYFAAALKPPSRMLKDKKRA